jgi:hypothetical protein
MAKEKKQEGKMDMQAMMDVYKKLAIPGVPHKLLASLAGSWITKTKGWMEPDKPPMEGKNAIIFTRAIGMLTKVSRFTVCRPRLPLSGSSWAWLRIMSPSNTALHGNRFPSTFCMRRCVSCKRHYQAGDLFDGVWAEAGNGLGAVVELPVGANTVTTLATFNGLNGADACGDRSLVVDASARAEEIMATRFHRVGTWQRWREPKRWFRGRGGHRIYHLRGSGAGRTFQGVTLLEVTSDFRLSRRIDAARMGPESSGNWQLDDVEERVFGKDGVSLTRFAHKVYRFEEDPEAFSVLPGQPAQMRRATLLEQTQLRRRLGLPSAEFDLEWHNKLAYPIACVPAGLLALALALRRGRTGHITAALMEAVAVSLAIWAMQGVAWSFGVSGRLPAAAAAWIPDSLLLGAGLWALWRRH